jgi:hypothetical protein
MASLRFSRSSIRPKETSSYAPLGESYLPTVYLFSEFKVSTKLLISLHNAQDHVELEQREVKPYRLHLMVLLADRSRG